MGSQNPKIKYCENTGKPNAKVFEDGLNIGLNRRGAEIIVPLGVDSWETICVAGKVKLQFKDERQIELLIDRLQELKALQENYTH